MIQAILCAFLLVLFPDPSAGQTDVQWQDITDVLGIASPERLPRSGNYSLTENFTGRAVPFDYDVDGDLDLLLTYGPQPADSLYSGLNRLYRQDDSGWVDVTAATGLARFPPASHAAVGDVDGDGYPDLYLCLFGADRLLRNDQGQAWHDITESAGISNDAWATEAVFFDANGDGALDLYVANYVAYQAADTVICIEPETGLRTICNPLLYAPAPNKLMINDGYGRFHDLTASLGMADSTSRSLGVTLLDANSDGLLDLLVLSDRSPNLLYFNDGDSGFVQSGILSGVALAPDGSEPSWSQALTLDANDDTHIDLILTRHDGELVLLLNDGSGTFFEGGYQAGLVHPRFPYAATGAAVLDLDFNGSLDLLLVDQNHVTRPDGNDSTAADSSGSQPATAAPLDRGMTRRIMLSDEAHRFYPASETVPMVLDTSLLIPKLPVSSSADDSEDYLAAGGFELDLGDAPVSPLVAASLVGDPQPDPGVKFRGIELDTLAVRQEASHYVVADLTGDGLQEIIAIYRAGLFRVWQRVVPRPPRFLGLRPRPGAGQRTVVGARLTVSGVGYERQMLLTHANPQIFYLPRRVRRVEVALQWPDGHQDRYRIRQLNRYYDVVRQVEQQ